jgi:type IV pilus assembly protein PilW
MNTQQSSALRARQAGFTLVEMLVAITIGLIVLLGMTASFVNLKTTFRSQDQLGQLQDNERLALSMLTTSINEAGYYPDPKNPSPIVEAIATATPGGTMPARTGIFGTADGGTATTTESLSTAYASVPGDGLMTCIGTTNTATGTTPVSVRNIFYVDPTTNSLMCKVMIDGGVSNAMANGGTPQPLITGIKSMSVVYGVGSAGSAQVQSYLTIPNVSNWTAVKAVRITLVFANPFDSTASVTRTHTINLMN